MVRRNEVYGNNCSKKDVVIIQLLIVPRNTKF